MLHDRAVHNIVHEAGRGAISKKKSEYGFYRANQILTARRHCTKQRLGRAVSEVFLHFLADAMNDFGRPVARQLTARLGLTNARLDVAENRIQYLRGGGRRG